MCGIVNTDTLPSLRLLSTLAELYLCFEKYQKNICVNQIVLGADPALLRWGRGGGGAGAGVPVYRDKQSLHADIRLAFRSCLNIMCILYRLMGI